MGEGSPGAGICIVRRSGGGSVGNAMTELERVLADPVRREAFRRRLLSYPRETEESVERKLRAYEERIEAKKYFRGPGLDWNALAEAELDENGYLRPPGWKAVFFYPDSRRPRNQYVALATFVMGLSFWFFH